MDKIRQENVETEGAINSNNKLDFLLTGDIVEYSTTRKESGLFSLHPTDNVQRIGVAVKFTDVHSGQIVLSETLTKEVKSYNATTNECCIALADDMISRIVEKLYPPMILSVSEKKKLL